MHRQLHTADLFAARRRNSLSFMALAVSLALAGCSSNTTTTSQNPTTGTIGPNTLNVADAALAGGDAPMALSVSQSILSTDPNNVDALVHEGDAYYALGRCPASEASYQDALRYDPKSAAAEIGLGRCLLKVDPARAELAFVAATQDDPGNAVAYSNLGIARDLQGNFAGAAAAYQQSLAIDAGSEATSVNYGLSLALSGQGEEALQYLGPIATGPDATPKIREDYAVALIAVGRNDDARQVLSIDLPDDKVNQEMAGFQALIAANIANPAPPPPPAPTATEVPTAPVAAAPIPQSDAAPVALTPMASAAPPPAAPVEAPVEAPPPVAMTPAAPPPTPVATAAPVATAPAATMPAATVKAAAAASPAPVPAAAPAVPPPEMAQAAAPAPAVQAAAMNTASVPAASVAPPPAPKPVTNVPSPAQVAAITPVAAAPAAMPQPMPLPAATPLPAAMPATGSAAVQIAALNSSAAARTEWQKVSAMAPALFAGKAPEISKVEVGGATYYRLRIGGFASQDDAAQFCSQLAAAGGPCMPANF